MSTERPNPEKLLQLATDEEREKRSGKLKIYLGAAPGVGKTYTMLLDAIAKREQGVDVVVGIVEGYGRKEIEALAQQLEILPRTQVEYRGKSLSEFDLDGALKRAPTLILMDEMAHTNVPGLRHNKRWQDIKELLDRGIDVYSTINVQHIESLNDVVTQILGARVQETVPDFILESADTIELVDLAPEDLLKRLQEGKVYFPKQAELAKDHFFRKGNLVALRELALRLTADQVGTQVLLYRQGQGIERIWPTKERLLVCVGSNPASIRVIRAARRMASHLQAEWLAVHVDTPALKDGEAARNNAVQNLRLAEKLGAETRILTGTDISKEIIHLARERNVTKIVLGKHIHSRLKNWLSRSLSDELIRNSGEIDIYIIHGDPTGAKPPPKPSEEKHPIPWKAYGIAIGVASLATLINFVLAPYLHVSNLIMVYLLGVTLVALLGRTGPSVLASILSVLAYDFFFIPTGSALSKTNIQSTVTLLIMLLVSQMISHLTISSRRQAEAARLAEQHTAALHTLSRQLASTRGVNKLLATAIRYIAEIFDSDVVALLPENDHLVIRSRYRTEIILDTKEQSIAQWVFDLGQTAGLGTDTLPYSDAIYVPLLASQGVVGVLRVHPEHPEHLLTPDQMHLLEACANQLALALEVDRLQEQAKKTELKTETDRARNALLQSVAHDLRAPLVAVMGAASTLMEMGKELSPQQITKLGKTIYVELEQLSRLINNLLQITYLEAEAVKLQKEFHSLNDLIMLVVKTSSKKLGKKQVHIHTSENLPEIPFDNTLLQEVLINLLDNAIKFTPKESPIDIFVLLQNSLVVVRVEDQGPGIMLDEVHKLFEKFYRGRMLTTERGLGLGLAICHSIIKAHGGEIWAENRDGGGAVFCFTLPLRP